MLAIVVARQFYCRISTACVGECGLHNCHKTSLVLYPLVWRLLAAGLPVRNHAYLDFVIPTDSTVEWRWNEMTSVVQDWCDFCFIPGCVWLCKFHSVANWPSNSCSHLITFCFSHISPNPGSSGMWFGVFPSRMALILVTNNSLTSGPVPSAMSFCFNSLQNWLLCLMHDVVWHLQKCSKSSFLWLQEGQFGG